MRAQFTLIFACRMRRRLWNDAIFASTLAEVAPSLTTVFAVFQVRLQFSQDLRRFWKRDANASLKSDGLHFIWGTYLHHGAITIALHLCLEPLIVLSPIDFRALVVRNSPTTEIVKMLQK